MLVDLLEKYNPSAEDPSLETLQTVFTTLEAQRIEQSSAMVRGARALGEYRVKTGVEECIARNRYFREVISNGEFYKLRFGNAK